MGRVLYRWTICKIFNRTIKRANISIDNAIIDKNGHIRAKKGVIRKVRVRKMNHTYDDFWLKSNMENMAYLFEYCDKYCKQLFKTTIDKEKFLNKFMRSDIRKEMEAGHPKLLSQSAIDSVEDYIEVDCDGNLKQFKCTLKHGCMLTCTIRKIYHLKI